MQIQISWLLQKPTDLDLHCLQRQDISWFSRTRVNHDYILQNGNTPLLRAIEEGVDAKTIQWLLKIRKGYSLLDRNKDGFTAREIAVKRGRDDVVKVIDKVCSVLGFYNINLFYCINPKDSGRQA